MNKAFQKSVEEASIEKVLDREADFSVLTLLQDARYLFGYYFVFYSSYQPIIILC